MSGALAPHCNLWLECEGHVVLSTWRVQMLEAIEATGSLSAAAERLQVQYRLVWDRLREMEEGLGVRLVERQVGGAGGGGARLTDAGRDYVARFRRFVESVEAVTAAAFRDAFGDRAR